MSRRHSYWATVRSRAAKAAKIAERKPEAPVKKTVKKKAVKKEEALKAKK
tara:strand:+ start:192 stop:341 length:150 start_codon:yes stop_codon:yes gene_type:complete